MSNNPLFSRDLSDSDEEDDLFVPLKSVQEVCPSLELSLSEDRNDLKVKGIHPEKPPKPAIITALSTLPKLYHVSSPVYEIDHLISVLMSLLDEYHSIQQSSLSKHMSDGFFNASLAKYKQTSFSQSFPQSDNLRMELEANVLLVPSVVDELTSAPETKGIDANDEKKVYSESDDDDACGFRSVGSEEVERSATPRLTALTLEKESINEDDKDEEGITFQLQRKQSLQENLLLFHGLPSTKLKQCQKNFSDALSDIVQLSLLKQQILIVCNLLERKTSSKSLLHSN